jgi:hypothetical protein
VVVEAVTDHDKELRDAVVAWLAPRSQRDEGYAEEKCLREALENVKDKPTAMKVLDNVRKYVVEEMNAPCIDDLCCVPQLKAVMDEIDKEKERLG